MTIYACDFGAGKALAFYGPNGIIPKKTIKLPRVVGSRLPWMEFPMYVEALMKGSETIEPGDVVVEAPTTKSSGCEPRHLLEILAKYPDRTLYTVTARAVKNFRKDNGEGWDKGARYRKDGDPVPTTIELAAQEKTHEEDARIIYTIATDTPYRLTKWDGVHAEIKRIYTSVRPSDKYEYTDERSEGFMKKLPPFDTLPQELRDVLGVINKRTKKLDYSRSMVMPFAMATDEPCIDAGPREERRRRYEKLIGLYDRGFPSFYRKATDVWLEVLSKQMTGKAKRNEITRDERKAAQKVMQRQVRMFFHLTMAHQGR